MWSRPPEASARSGRRDAMPAAGPLRGFRGAHVQFARRVARTGELAAQPALHPALHPTSARLPAALRPPPPPTLARHRRRLCSLSCPTASMTSTRFGAVGASKGANSSLRRARYVGSSCTTHPHPPPCHSHRGVLLPRRPFRIVLCWPVICGSSSKGPTSPTHSGLRLSHWNASALATTQATPCSHFSLLTYHVSLAADHWPLTNDQ